MTRYTPLYIQPGIYPASQDRQMLASVWSGPASSGLAVTVATNQTLNIAPGVAAIPTANATGTTLGISDAVEQITLQAYPVTNSRIDLVCVQARGNDLDGGANNDLIFTSVTGTAAASPIAPATPAGMVTLYQALTNSAGVTTLTDVRPWALNPLLNGGITTAPAPGITPLTIKGAVGQTANPFIIQNNAGTTLFQVSKDGLLYNNNTTGGSSGNYLSGPTEHNASLNIYPTSASGLYVDATYNGVANSNLLVLRFTSNQATDVMQLLGVSATKLAWFDSNAALHINAAASTIVPLTLKGAASQTANLQEWWNSSSQLMLKVTAAGDIAYNTLNYLSFLDPTGQNLLKMQSWMNGAWTDNQSAVILSTGLAASGYAWIIGAGGTNLTRLGINANVVHLSTAQYPSAVPPVAGYRLQVDGNVLAQSETIIAPTVSTIPLTLQGAASQTGDLLDIKNSGSTLIANIDSTGVICTGSAGLKIPRHDTAGPGGGLNGLITYNTTPQFAFTSGSYNSGFVGLECSDVGGNFGADRIYFPQYGNVSVPLNLNVGTAAGSALGQLTVLTTATTNIGQVIKLFTSQTADALQIQNSGGTVLTKLNATGWLTTPNTTITRVNNSDNASLVLNSPGLGGDNFITINRGGASNEWMTLLAAAGGTSGSGLNNVYTIDRVGVSAPTTRALWFRYSIDNASTYTTVFGLESPNVNGGGVFIGPTPSWGSGTGPMLFLANDTADPSANPTGGVILFSSGGILKARDPSGAITQLAPAVATISWPLTNAAATATTVQYQTQVTADTQYRFIINARGDHSWGNGSAVTDTQLARTGNGILSLTAGARAVLSVQGGVGITEQSASATPLSIQAAASQTGPLTSWANSGGVLFAWINSSGLYNIWVPGDTVSRFQVADATGTINWGPGNAGADTTLYRSSAGQLTMGISGGSQWDIGGSGANAVITFHGNSAAVSYALAATASSTSLNVATGGTIYARVNGSPLWQTTVSGTSFPTAPTSFGAGSLSAGKWVTIGATASSDIPLTISGAASQSGPLTNWNNNSGQLLMTVPAAGGLNVQSAGDTAPRLSIAPTGSLSWSGGSGSYDVVLSRTVAATLTMNFPGTTNGTMVFTAGKLTTPLTELVLEQTGDVSGACRLHLRNRGGAGGALFENPNLDLVDFGFLPQTHPQGNIRLEGRSQYYGDSANTSYGEFQFMPGSGSSIAYGWIGSVGSGVYGRFSVGSAPSWGAGTGPMLFLANDSADPTANPTSGVLLYSSAGVLKVRTPDGTTTPLAPLVPMILIAPNAITVPLTIKAAASPTADLLQFQSSTSSILARIDAGGNLFSGNISTYGSLTGTGASLPINATIINLAGQTLISSNGQPASIGVTSPALGGGSGPMLFLANDSVDPSSSPTGGLVLYSSAGVLKAKTPDGTVTPLAPGGAYAPVSSGVAPNASLPGAVPPAGLLWVDTSVTAASFIGPPGQPDLGVNAATPDLNTFQSSGNTVFTGSPTNAPPIPPGAFTLAVIVMGNGTYIQQRATLIAQPQFIATREYASGAWGAWRSPAAGLITSVVGPGSTMNTASNNVCTITYTVIAGRKYRLSMFVQGTQQTSTGEARNSLSGPTDSAQQRFDNKYAVAAAQNIMSFGVYPYSPGTTGSQTWTLTIATVTGTIQVTVNCCHLMLEDMGTG